MLQEVNCQCVVLTSVANHWWTKAMYVIQVVLVVVYTICEGIESKTKCKVIKNGGGVNLMSNEYNFGLELVSAPLSNILWKSTKFSELKCQFWPKMRLL